MLPSPIVPALSSAKPLRRPASLHPLWLSSQPLSEPSLPPSCALPPQPCGAFPPLCAVFLHPLIVSFPQLIATSLQRSSFSHLLYASSPRRQGVSAHLTISTSVRLLQQLLIIGQVQRPTAPSQLSPLPVWLLLVRHPHHLLP